jgi:hypothetical protein
MQCEKEIISLRGPNLSTRPSPQSEAGPLQLPPLSIMALWAPGAGVAHRSTAISLRGPCLSGDSPPKYPTARAPSAIGNPSLSLPIPSASSPVATAAEPPRLRMVPRAVLSPLRGRVVPSVTSAPAAEPPLCPGMSRSMTSYTQHVPQLS